MRRRRRSLSISVALALTVLLGACGSGARSTGSGPASTLHDDTVTVGSFDFAESELLAEIYSQALEHGGYHVQRAFGLGPREFVGPALARGLVELVPEYAGTGLLFFSAGADTAGPDAARTHAALAKALHPLHLAALAAAPAQDANAFAVTRETADRYGLHSLSDLAGAGPRLVFGGPPECPSRPLCLGGLERVYGVRFKEVIPYLDAGGPVTRQALLEGDIDVGLVFSTDPAATSDGLVELVDDRSLQPAENVTPVVRTEIVDRWGDGLTGLIDDVSARLTTDALRELNADVAGGKSIRSVAATWMEAQQQR
jgi:osmoprotectant transport system substrate-binding protein